jgi:hypothetical protein
MIEFFYWAMVAAFFTHELDAVKRHEWRILPILSRFPDRPAEQVFIWAHVPLFLAIIWFSRNGAETPFTLAFSVFAIAHVGLHWAFRKHPRNEFIGTSSWAIILLTGALGTAHLAAYVWR